LLSLDFNLILTRELLVRFAGFATDRQCHRRHTLVCFGFSQLLIVQKFEYINTVYMQLEGIRWIPTGASKQLFPPSYLSTLLGTHHGRRSMARLRPQKSNSTCRPVLLLLLRRTVDGVRYACLSVY